MRILILALILVFTVATVEAQDVPFEKSRFPGQKKELKMAKSQMKKGLKLAGKGAGYQKEAMELLLSAHAFNPNNALLNLRIGEIIFKGNDPHLALPYLEKAYSLNPKVSKDIFYLLGRAYHLNHYFELALSFYKEYGESLDSKAKKRIAPTLALLNSQARTGDSLVKNPTTIFIDNMGDRINSIWPEYAPVLTPDGQKLWFTSRRPGSTGGGTDKNEQFYEDIYVIEKVGSAWSEPLGAGAGINTDKHESSGGISRDGMSLYVRIGNPTGDLYEARKEQDKEVKMKKLPKSINSSGNETSITFSPDSTRVWFVSDRKKGYGGKDIWMCQAKRKGGWKKAVNAGPMVNTIYDEESPFMAGDNKTFYFSSQGHSGMGGFDVYTTTFDSGSFAASVNLGFPLNSAADDLFFSLDPKGRAGYLASARFGGSGYYDLYRVKMVNVEKPVMKQTDTFEVVLEVPGIESISPLPALKPYEPVILLNGIVKDAEQNTPLKASINLIDPATGKVVETFESSSSTGNFLINLPAKRKYIITLNSMGFFPAIEEVDITPLDAYATTLRTVTLYPVYEGNGIELINTTFPGGEAILSQTNTTELDLLISFLKLNSSVKVMVMGYASGGEERVKLPAARAAKIADYLVTQGIAADRVKAETYTLDEATSTVSPEPGTKFIRILVTGI